MSLLWLNIKRIGI